MQIFSSTFKHFFQIAALQFALSDQTKDGLNVENFPCYFHVIVCEKLFLVEFFMANLHISLIRVFNVLHDPVKKWEAGRETGTKRE